MFVIASQPRCGTHFLRTALMCHPDITCYSEIFVYEVAEELYKLSREMRAEDVLHHFEAMERDTNKWGFALHRWFNANWMYPNPWSCIPLDTPIIKVSRKNRLEQIVSRKKTLLTKQYNIGKDSNDEIKDIDIHLTKDDLENELAQLESFEEQWNTIGFTNVFEVTYEEMCHDWDGVISNAQIFLEVEAQPLSTLTIKIGKPAQKTLPNFEQLKQECIGTKLAPYFS